MDNFSIIKTVQTVFLQDLVTYRLRNRKFKNKTQIKKAIEEKKKPIKKQNKV